MTLNEILQAIIDGRQLQFKVEFGWQTLCTDEALYYLGNDYKLSYFRIKPATVSINGFEVPAPLKDAPKTGEKYWIEMPHGEMYNIPFGWTNNMFDRRCLTRGIAHATEANAIMSCKARLGINPHKEN